MSATNRNTNTRKIGRISGLAAIWLLAMMSGTASADVVKLDGIFDAADEAYSTTTSVFWYNDHHSQFPKMGESGWSPLQTTTVRYGTGTLAGGNLEEFFFLYVEAPLSNKNLVWGTGASDAEIALYNIAYSTHHDPLSNDPTSKEYFDFEKAVGSEKFEFNGIKASPKADKKTNTFGGDEVSGDGIVNAVSSIAYILENGCTVAGCDRTDLAFSYEFQFELSAAADLIAFFSNPNSEIKTHLSPERGGTLVEVPEPGSLVLFGLGLAAFGLSRRKKQA